MTWHGACGGKAPAEGRREKEPNMKFRLKGAPLAIIVPALALATPAFAQVRNAVLSDSQEPGSVIIFPKFVGNTAASAVTLPESPPPPAAPLKAPVTELEIGVVCPIGVICPEHEAVKIRFHWVCGTT